MMAGMRLRTLALVPALLLAWSGLVAGPVEARTPPGVAPPAVAAQRVQTAAVVPVQRAALRAHHRALPPGSGSGRRIVYTEQVPQHIWLVNADGRVERDFAASGRRDWPRAGVYHVFSKSAWGSNPGYGVTFRWMVRFTIGHTAAIGFHSIPRYRDGRPMQTLAQLGQAVGRGGCAHSADPDARYLFDWARIGTKVVVLR